MGVVEPGGRRLFMVYTLRNAEHPGIMAVVSENEGKTWDCTHQIMVWDAAGKSHGGSAAGNLCLADMATYAFGKPQAILTSDGTILASFWCTEACVTHIRWCRIAVR
jgi:hypothetical protein